MGEILKLFFISLIVVAVAAGAALGLMPDLRNQLLGKAPDKTLPQETPPEGGKNALNPVGGKASAKTLKQVEDFSKELSDLEKNLKQREENLKLREERFKGREEEVAAMQKELQGIFENIAQYLPKISDAEKKNLKKLAKMFETLSSENANPMMTQMPDETLVVVLSFMKPRSSAKLLGGFGAVSADNARRAAKLTEMLKKLVIQ